MIFQYYDFLLYKIFFPLYGHYEIWLNGDLGVIDLETLFPHLSATIVFLLTWYYLIKLIIKGGKKLWSYLS